MYSLPVGFRMVAPIAGSARGPIGSTIEAASGLLSPHSLYSDGTQLTVGATSASCNYLQGHLASDAVMTLPTSLPGTTYTNPA